MNLNSAPSFKTGGRLSTGIYADNSFNDLYLIGFDIEQDGTLTVAYGGYHINPSTTVSILSYANDGSLINDYSQDINETSFKLNPLTHNPDSFSKQLNDGSWLVASDGSLIKTDAVGNIDTTFGSAGKLSLIFEPFGYELTVRDIYVLPDGQFYTFKARNVYSGSAPYIIEKYNENGSLDTTFNNNTGYLHMDEYHGDVKVAFSQNGSIFVAGMKDYNHHNNQSYELLSFDANGLPNTAYSQDATFEIDNGYIYHVAMQAGDKLLALHKGTLYRFNQNGLLDNSFGIGGSTYTSKNTHSFIVLDDDKILVGERETFTRLMPNGTLDNTWSQQVTFPNQVTLSQTSAEPIKLNEKASVIDSDLAYLNNNEGNYDGATITVQRKGEANYNDVFYINDFEINNNEVVYAPYSDISVPLDYGITTNNESNDQDVIGLISSQIGTFSLTFTENATQEMVNTLLQNISYYNIHPFARNQTVDFEWIFSDGNHAGLQGEGREKSVSAETTVEITPYIYELNRLPDVEVTVKGNQLSFEQHESIFELFRKSRTHNELSFSKHLEYTRLNINDAEPIVVTNDHEQIRLPNGDLFSAIGSNLQKDNSTLNSLVYTKPNGLEITLSGALSISPNGSTGNFNAITLVDNRGENNITHHYSGEFNAEGYGNATYYSMEKEGVEVSYSGDFHLSSASNYLTGTLDSIHYNDANNNSVTFSYLSQQSISDFLKISSFSKIESSILNLNNNIIGSEGNDLFDGGLGNDSFDGKEGTDTVLLNITLSELKSIRLEKKGGVSINSTEGVDTLKNIEKISFIDIELSIDELFNLQSTPVYSALIDGINKTITPSHYLGPVSFLEYEFIGESSNDIVTGSVRNDFINLLGGDDAANGGDGDDVLDGGTGSNFLTTGSGSDTIFLDGRSKSVTWSTVTDFSDDEVNIWGWNEATSKLLLTEELGGAIGYEGATFHYDLNNDGQIDTSITFTGLNLDQVPSQSAKIIEDSGYLLIA